MLVSNDWIPFFLQKSLEESSRCRVRGPNFPALRISLEVNCRGPHVHGQKSWSRLSSGILRKTPQLKHLRSVPCIHKHAHLHACARGSSGWGLLQSREAVMTGLCSFTCSSAAVNKGKRRTARSAAGVSEGGGGRGVEGERLKLETEGRTEVQCCTCDMDSESNDWGKNPLSIRLRIRLRRTVLWSEPHWPIRHLLTADRRSFRPDAEAASEGYTVMIEGRAEEIPLPTSRLFLMLFILFF